MNSCYACGEVILLESIGRRSVCDACGVDLRCCFQCEFYDSSASSQCREPQAELVLDKEKGNFCDYFRPAAHPKRGGGIGSEEAKHRLDDLFKK